MEKIFKGFLSCSFDEKDEDLKNFFKEYIEGHGFQIIIYDFQEPSSMPVGIKNQIQKCDCLIALLTQRLKIADSDKFTFPEWISSEMAWADSFGKPIITLIEEGINLEGFLKSQRYEHFNRDSLLKSLPKITKYLTSVRDFLVKRDTDGSIPSPILMRNSIDSVIEFRSKKDFMWGAQVKMTSLADNVASCDHYNVRKVRYPRLSERCKKFTFKVINKPEHVNIKYKIDRNDREKFLWRLIFDPPLAQGENLEYYYKQISKNNEPFTLEEAKERAEAPGYLFSEPVASLYWNIVYPTERLKIDVSFPEGYVVKNPKLLVEIGRSGNFSQTELSRLQKSKSFEISKIAGKTKLILNVRKPYWGYKYWIIWTPPNENELSLSKKTKN